MARKTSFLALRSTYGFLQKSRSALIAWLALVIRSLISMSSVRSKDMNDPRYLKCAVKSMKDPSSSSRILLVFGDCQYSSSRCFADMVQKVRGWFRFVDLPMLSSFGGKSSSNSSGVSDVGSNGRMLVDGAVGAFRVGVSLRCSSFAASV